MIRVQRCYHVEYGGKILHWLEQFKEIGSVCIRRTQTADSVCSASCGNPSFVLARNFHLFKAAVQIMQALEQDD